MRIPFSYIWRSLWARRLTTTLTLGGVALVVFVFAGVLMLARGLEATLVDTGSPDNAVVLRGVSPQAFELRPGFRVTQGRPFQFGTHEIVVGKNIADRFKGVAVGAELSFGGDRWTVVGIADAGGTGFDSEIWGDADQLMQAFGRPVYSSVTFRLRDPGAFDAVKARLQADPRSQSLELKREQDFYRERSEEHTSELQS